MESVFRGHYEGFSVPFKMSLKTSSSFGDFNFQFKFKIEEYLQNQVSLSKIKLNYVKIIIDLSLITLQVYISTCYTVLV